VAAIERASHSCSAWLLYRFKLNVALSRPRFLDQKSRPSFTEQTAPHDNLGAPSMASETKLETTYCKEIPSGQTALDIFKGTWKSALPPEFGLRAGAEPAFFQDPRVFWAQKILPSGFQDLSILELGPFEGYAAYLMEQLGAKNILAIEGNTINFLKCLVIKDVLRLRAEFLCGDFLKYFHSTQQRFDLIWASGILYHSESPWELLNQITEHTDRVFFWTHYYEESLGSGPWAQHFSAKKNIQQVWHGKPYDLFWRSYLLHNYTDGVPLHYEGGQLAYSYWVRKEDLIQFLHDRGFSRIDIHEDGSFSDMPYFSFLAQRG